MYSSCSSQDLSEEYKITFLCLGIHDPVCYIGSIDISVCGRLSLNRRMKWGYESGYANML
jgi:hypothetical protein